MVLLAVQEPAKASSAAKSVVGYRTPPSSDAGRRTQGSVYIGMSDAVAGLVQRLLDAWRYPSRLRELEQRRLDVDAEIIAKSRGYGRNACRRFKAWFKGVSAEPARAIAYMMGYETEFEPEIVHGKRRGRKPKGGLW